MGFLDNSGDIILDAVLTDTGRKRLAEGDFSIVKFALGDDEINYQLYNPSHPSGSSYYDLEIVQTPVLESFTNNTSTMKSRLITVNSNNLLYLPVIKEETTGADTKKHTSGVFLVAVDDKTQRTTPFDPTSTGVRGGVGRLDNNDKVDGVLFGKDPGAVDSRIRLDQGIDNTNKPKTTALNTTLIEDSYIIQIDGRFGDIVDINGKDLTTSLGLTSAEDDDGFLFYTVDSSATTMLTKIGTNAAAVSSIAGSRGSRLEFKIKASEVLKDNFSYFDRYGFISSIVTSDRTIPIKAIDTTVRVTGIKLGYSIDIPVRFVKATDSI